MQEETIAGIASGMGGGISIIRISGENALQVVGSIFRNNHFSRLYFLSLPFADSKDIFWYEKCFLQPEEHSLR